MAVGSAIVLIPVYHSVSALVTAAYQPFAITPETLAAHLARLRENGYQSLTVSALLAAGADLPEKTIVLTFDDGLEDFYTGALPVLQEYGYPATLYVASGQIGQTSTWLSSVGEGARPMMNWAQLRETAALGIEIGAHSLTHPELDTLNAADAAREIGQSRTILENGLGLAVRTFAYPYGYHGGAVRRHVRDAGYDSACAVKNKRCSPDADRFALARMTVMHDHGADTLARWLTPDGPVRDDGRVAPQTRLWWLYRNVRARRG